MIARIKLIVGLGNYGNEYLNTRHNVGFWVVDDIATKYNATFKLENKFFGLLAKFKYLNEDIFLLKPQTYMNLSGKSVQSVVNFFKINANEVLIIHDELDLNIGISKLKFAGGNGGHNGLKSIDSVLGKNYWRLRVGVGHPGEKDKVIGYVLQKPSFKDKEYIIYSYVQAIELLPYLFEAKFEAAQKKLHTKI